MTATAFSYSFASTNAPPPNDRQLRLDAAQALALNLYVDNNVTDGTDVSAQLLAAQKGDTIRIAQVSDATRFVNYTIKSTPVDRSGYIQFSVASSGSGGALVTGQAVTLTLDRVALAGFRCYTIIEDEEQGEFVGAGPDLPTAVAIACTMFTTLQMQSVATWRAVAVYDPTGKQVAWCGRYSDESAVTGATSETDIP